MNKRVLWVVEIKEKGQWVPSVNADITRSLARKLAKSSYRFHETRIRKYVPEGK